MDGTPRGAERSERLGQGNRVSSRQVGAWSLPFYRPSRTSYAGSRISHNSQTRSLKAPGCESQRGWTQRFLDVASAFEWRLCPVADHVGQLGRRLFGLYCSPSPPSLGERVKEIESGTYDDEYEELQTISLDELKKKYTERDMEG